jgi:hypothetical protein
MSEILNKIIGWIEFLRKTNDSMSQDIEILKLYNKSTIDEIEKIKVKISSLDNLFGGDKENDNATTENTSK